MYIFLRNNAEDMQKNFHNILRENLLRFGLPAITFAARLAIIHQPLFSVFPYCRGKLFCKG
jgi:hypothetical protein